MATLSEIKKEIRPDWYRCPIEKEVLRKLCLKSDKKGFVQAGGHLAIFFMTGSLTYVFWHNSIWYAFLAMLFVHGTVSSFLSGVAPHELAHGTVFRTKFYNKFFLYLYSLISWWDPYDYASSHTYHHRYTMYPAVDRENLLPLQPSLSPITLFQIFTLNLFSKPDRVFSKGGFFSTVYLTGLSSFGRIGSTQIPCQEWLQALHHDQPLQHRKSIIWSRILLLFHSFILIVSIISGHWWLFLVITLSSFMANWASYFVGLTQHCGLQNNVPDFRKNTRTITLNPILSFLYWHMNWHIEHHMFAGVPCYNLKKLHEEIKLDMPEPRTLIGAWKEMVEIWRVQKFDQDYQFDTPIPDSRMKDKRVNADPLASSIGDLAPNF